MQHLNFLWIMHKLYFRILSNKKFKNSVKKIQIFSQATTLRDLWILCDPWEWHFNTCWVISTQRESSRRWQQLVQSPPAAAAAWAAALLSRYRFFFSSLLYLIASCMPAHILAVTM